MVRFWPSTSKLWLDELARHETPALPLLRVCAAFSATDRHAVQRKNPSLTSCRSPLHALSCRRRAWFGGDWVGNGQGSSPSSSSKTTPDHQELVRMHLSREGIEDVEVVDSLEAAVDSCGQRRPEVVVVDTGIFGEQHLRAVARAGGRQPPRLRAQLR